MALRIDIYVRPQPSKPSAMEYHLFGRKRNRKTTSLYSSSEHKKKYKGCSCFRENKVKALDFNLTQFYMYICRN